MLPIDKTNSVVIESLPMSLDRAVEAFVLSDLTPPQSTVHAKVGTAAIVGGLAALVLCGQFGLGFTEFARNFGHEMHEQMGALPCALTCGMLYSIFPVLLLRFVLCSALQFKVVTRRHTVKIAVWLGGCGAVMAAFGHHGSDLLQLGAWLVAALGTTYILVRMTERIGWAGLWTAFGRRAY